MHLEEAARLRAIWDRTAEERRARNVHSQGAFGEAYNIGNQAAVGFFLNGKTALSLKAALGFAKGLGCKVSDFSDRLDRELNALSEVASPAEPLAALNGTEGHLLGLYRMIGPAKRAALLAEAERLVKGGQPLSTDIYALWEELSLIPEGAARREAYALAQAALAHRGTDMAPRIEPDAVDPPTPAPKASAPAAGQPKLPRARSR
ncbi:MAG: hypothetical protein IIZ92_03360 [Aquincola sp.]|nr:hypothetical protein [Aquincola sp.]